MARAFSRGRGSPWPAGAAARRARRAPRPPSRRVPCRTLSCGSALPSCALPRNNNKHARARARVVRNTHGMHVRHAGRRRNNMMAGGRGRSSSPSARRSWASRVVPPPPLLMTVSPSSRTRRSSSARISGSCSSAALSACCDAIPARRRRQNAPARTRRNPSRPDRSGLCTVLSRVSIARCPPHLPLLICGSRHAPLLIHG